jgi:tetratricopeptide (TPR) repeat protein
LTCARPKCASSPGGENSPRQSRSPTGPWKRPGSSQRRSTSPSFPAAAALRLALGETTDALALLSELQRIPNVRDAPYYPANLPDAVRTALVVGDPDLAASLAEGVELIYPLHEYAVATARALLHEHRGEHPEAVELFSDASEGWQRFEMPWERAQALLGQGRCLLELGRTSEATTTLRDAREMFASLEAQPTIAETDALLERATALTS